RWTLLDKKEQDIRFLLDIAKEKKKSRVCFFSAAAAVTHLPVPRTFSPAVVVSPTRLLPVTSLPLAPPREARLARLRIRCAPWPYPRQPRSEVPPLHPASLLQSALHLRLALKLSSPPTCFERFLPSLEARSGSDQSQGEVYVSIWVCLGCMTDTESVA
ncbi:unnamed protein product, partial [Urochloa humidicola]